MNDLIDKFNPMSMAIEDSFYSQNVKSAILLGQARGVLLLSAASRGIPSMVYAPRKVCRSPLLVFLVKRETLEAAIAFL